MSSVTNSDATSRQLSADLINGIVEAAAKDTVHQIAMLLSVVEVLANHSSDTHRTAICGSDA